MRVSVLPHFLKSTELISHHQQGDHLINNLLFIKQGTLFYKVKLDDILYIESDNVYIHIYLTDKKFLVRSTIDQYLKILNSKQFFKVHRSFAININHVQFIDINHLAINSIAIPIGKSYKNELLSSLRLG